MCNAKKRTDCLSSIDTHLSSHFSVLECGSYVNLSDKVQLSMRKGVTHDAVSRMVKYPSWYAKFWIG